MRESLPVITYAITIYVHHVSAMVLLALHLLPIGSYLPIQFSKSPPMTLLSHFAHLLCGKGQFSCIFHSHAMELQKYIIKYGENNSHHTLMTVHNSPEQNIYFI